MKANANLTLRGTACTLVPYKPEHVPLYHEWMKDPEMQEATASEPLSIDEEYTMQRDWADDEKKCTFIILDPTAPDKPDTSGRGLGGMCGDVNLFFNDHDDELGTAEIEIMVAAKQSRRKGVAGEALRIMMAYAFAELGVKTFRAKICFDNAASLALFAGLGYAEVSRSDIFREATLELSLGGGGRGGGSGGGKGGVRLEEDAAAVAAAVARVTERARARTLLGGVWDSVVKGAHGE